MKPALTNLKNIIISRTDSIGDVILTLPLAKIVKEKYPAVKIGFMGKAYTKAVIESCSYVDEFIDVADFLKQEILVNGAKPEAIIHVFPVKEIAIRAKALKIPFRIGTTNRLYHWSTCNKLIRLSRKKSDLHEAQLNTKLLAALNINKDFSLEELGNSFGFNKVQSLPNDLAKLIDPSKFNLILHPKSQGSAREWGLDNFIALIKELPRQDYKIFISGTQKERESLDPLFTNVGNLVTDICGRMDLKTFISFINACDGLVANSTGPLHIAAALGKKAIGIYPNLRPMHPGRWRPLGKNATFVTTSEANSDRIEDIPVSAILEKLRVSKY